MSARDGPNLFPFPVPLSPSSWHWNASTVLGAAVCLVGYLWLIGLVRRRSGAAPATVLRLTGTRLVVELSRPGQYRLAVRYSPYWHADGACLILRKDGMTTIAARHAGRLELSFRVNAASALAAVGGRTHVCDLH